MRRGQWALSYFLVIVGLRISPLPHSHGGRACSRPHFLMGVTCGAACPGLGNLDSGIIVVGNDHIGLLWGVETERRPAPGPDSDQAPASVGFPLPPIAAALWDCVSQPSCHSSAVGGPQHSGCGALSAGSGRKEAFDCQWAHPSRSHSGSSCQWAVTPPLCPSRSQSGSQLEREHAALSHGAGTRPGHAGLGLPMGGPGLARVRHLAAAGLVGPGRTGLMPA